jgi:hypothetical protein
MPPRWLCLLILLFWLATTGRLLWRDLWPALRPGEPPPYAIDLLDEAQQQQPRIHWRVLYNDRPSHRARSWVEHHPRDDAFALHVTLDAEPRPDALPAVAALLRHFESVHVVSRDGALRQVHCQARLVPGLVEVDLTFEGQVRDGRLYPRYHLDSADLHRHGEADPVEVSSSGSLLVPLHPLNRIRGIRPGQSWRLPLVDPAYEAIVAVLRKEAGGALLGLDRPLPVLDAHVLPEPRHLHLLHRDWACLVVEYHDGDDLRARTWVEQRTGLVLQQEAIHGDEHWVFLRDSAIDDH